MNGDNLSVGLLDLLELTQKVPESGLGDDLVGCKDPHPVELGSRLLLGRELAAENGVLGETAHLWRIKVA